MVENRRAVDDETPEQTAERRRSLTSFFSSVIKGYSAFLFTAAAGLILLCRPIAALLFDVSFAEAWRYIPLLALATLLSSLSNFTGTVYMVEGRSVAALVTAMIGALTNIVLNLLLIPPMGAMGAALATALSYLLVLVLRLISTRRSIPYRYAPVWQVLCFSLLCGLCAVVTLASRGWIVWSIVLFSLTVALSSVHLIPGLLHLLRRRMGK